ASAAIVSGAGAVRRVLAGEAAGVGFTGAAVAAAVAGSVLAHARADSLAGGVTMLFFYDALALVWILTALTAAVAARRGRPLVARDWTLYSFAVALVPATVVLSLPLWAALPVMDLDNAAVSAATMAFAGHYLVAQLVISEVLDRRRPAPAC
ncbi:MAG: hypothetical protein ACU85V_01085, partial [Gammaproteobacteria bacterium]